MTTTRPQPAPNRATSTPTQMRAIVQDTYGNADTLHFAEVPVPTPGAGEVLLAVHAAGLNRGTWHLMTGLPYVMRLMGFGLRRPAQRAPGTDVAGRIIAVGEGVDDLTVGDEVMGIAVGAFAPYAIARAEKLVLRPATLPVEKAAAVAISGITAYQAVHVAGRVTAGQRVLVLGASGGVGAWVTQLAHAAGAHVTGVASATKAQFVLELGAERVIDYATTEPTSGTDRYDVIIDMGGRRPLRKLRRILTKTGTLVIVGGEGGGRIGGGFGRQLLAAALSPLVSQQLLMVMSNEHRDVLEPVAAAIAQGTITPAVTSSYPLDSVVDAMTDLAEGRVSGSAVLRIGEES